MKFVKCTPQELSQIQQRLQRDTRLKLTQFLPKIVQRDTQDYAPLQRRATNSQTWRTNSHNFQKFN